MREAWELAGGDALDVEEADHGGQPEQRDQAEALDVQLRSPVEGRPNILVAKLTLLHTKGEDRKPRV